MGSAPKSWELSDFNSELCGTSQRSRSRGASGFSEVTTMDWNRIEGNWKQAQGKIKEKWGKLTDDDLTTINGRREQLEGIIEKRYGLAKDMVRKDVDDWLKSQP
jgi:uncharacterized protein YjbJ (UPF0337 family)